MILHKKVIDFVFLNNCILFYHILNTPESFDINWFRYYYSYNNNDLSNTELFEIYRKQNLYGNDYHALNKDQPLLKDCMIEHVFERIWLNVIKHLKGNYILL
jgi:hypothetical protein